MSIASVSLCLILLNFGTGVISFNDLKKQALPFNHGKGAKNNSNATQLEFSGKFAEENGSQLAWLKIKPVGKPCITPVDICCVVDVSSSMQDFQTIRGADGNVQHTGLTTLNLVKHSLLTVIESMGEDDKLTIITFSSKSEVKMPTSPMNTTNKAIAKNVVNGLTGETTTNLWAGIKTGWDAVRENKCIQENAVETVSSLFVFTDGANVAKTEYPIPEMISRYAQQYGGQPCAINTFGFGCDLESDMLDTIARQCNGSYVYISDIGLVGTVFANATANLFTVTATEVFVEIPDKPEYVIQVLGDYEVVYDRNVMTINVGDVRSEQSRDIILQISQANNATPLPEMLLRYTAINNVKRKSVLQAQTTQAIVQGEFTFHILRSRFVDAVNAALVKLRNPLREPDQIQLTEEYNNILNALQFESEDEETVNLSAPLFVDVDVQVKLAFNKDEYLKWGKHYLPSLCRAHRLQSCNNFKDKGVQVYGGKVFKAVREVIIEFFNKLPPPIPRKLPSHYSAPQTANTVVSFISTFNNAGAACFHGDSAVYLENGSTKRASEIRKGDKVMTKDNGEATVLCVLVTEIKQGSLGLVRFAEGVLVTPYHPFFFEGTQTWEFPIEILNQIEQVPCKQIFSYLLSDNHSIIINGVAFITLGHGMDLGVLSHAYFGTQRVVQDLMRNSGWKDLIVRCNKTKRDRPEGPVTGLELIEPTCNASSQCLFDYNVNFVF